MRTWPFLLALAAGCGSSVAGQSTESILRATTQAMMDAVAVGDRPVWDRALDPDVVCTAEDGAVKDKRALLAEIEPLPAGITGKIVVQDMRVRDYGGFAVTTYVADEHEVYFGHPIHAQYRATETWRRTDQGWRLVATQNMALLQDPPAIELAPARLDEYAGSYALAASIIYTIQRVGTALVGRRGTGKEQTLKVEAADVLFVPGQPRSRKVFLRGPDGKITGFVDRREARDVPWTRRP
jgi:ketosteroid isomerase-like protein